MPESSLPTPASPGGPATAEPATAQPATAQPASPEHPRRRRFADLTNNAFFSGALTTIAAGIFAFLIAHYQGQEAVSQAMSAERASVAVQLETAATGLYDATYQVWPSCQKNPIECQENPAYIDAGIEFTTAQGNISDPRASELAKQLSYLSLGALRYADSGSGSAYLDQLPQTFQELMNRCGQLITAQQ